MPLEDLNVPGLVEKAETLNNVMTLHHSDKNDFIYGKIDNKDMDVLFHMLEAHLPEEDKPIQRYIHEGDTGDCHCTLFDYHVAPSEVIEAIDNCTRSFQFTPKGVTKFVEEKYGKHKIFYCVQIRSPSLMKWLDDNDLACHMNKNLGNTMHYTIAEASWKASNDSLDHQHHHHQNATLGAPELKDLSEAGPTLYLPKPFGPRHTVKVAAGKNLRLCWHATPDDDSGVRLQFAVNSWGHSISSWQTIRESVPNTGEYIWTVPAEAEPDDRYYVHITHLADSSIQVDSDYFEIC
jgi:hypothetical protein